MERYERALRAKARVAALIEQALIREEVAPRAHIVLGLSPLGDGSFAVRVATNNEDVRAALPTELDGIEIRLAPLGVSPLAPVPV